MNKFYYISLIVCFYLVPYSAKSQKINWLYHGVSTSSDADNISSSTIDNSGNVYYMFNGGNVKINSRNTGYGKRVVKIDKNGKVDKIQPIIADKNHQKINDFTVDSDANIYMWGSFYEQYHTSYHRIGVNFKSLFIKYKDINEIDWIKSSSLEILALEFVNNKIFSLCCTSTDIVVQGKKIKSGTSIVEFSNLGDIISVVHISTPDREKFNSIKIDENGNIYLIGKFIDSQLEFNGYTIDNSTTENFTVIKFDKNYNVLWQKPINVSNRKFTHDNITVSPSGVVYVSGKFKGNIKVNSKVYYSKLYSNVLIQLNSSGKIENSTVFKVNDSNNYKSIIKSDNYGNIYFSNGSVLACVNSKLSSLFEYDNIKNVTTLEVADTKLYFTIGFRDSIKIGDYEFSASMYDYSDIAVGQIELSYDYSKPGIVATSKTICGTKEVTLSIQNNSVQNCNWYHNNNIVGSDSEFLASKEGEYIVFVNTDSSNLSDTISLTKHDGIPASIINAEDNILCENETLILNTNIDNKYSYKWYRESDILKENAGSIEISNQGIYYLEVSSDNCVNTDSIYISKINKPAEIIYKNEMTEANFNVSYFNQIDTISDIKWFYENETTPFSNDYNNYLRLDGKYRIVKSNICGTTTDSLKYKNENYYSNRVKIFPTICNQNVCIYSEENEYVKVKIYDLDKENIHMEYEGYVTVSNGVYKLDINELQEGKYIVEVEIDNIIHSKKIIKHI